jgi:hypothetical protein
MLYWRFKHGSVTEPVEDSRTTVDYSQDAEDFDTLLPMLPQDYRFHVPVPSDVEDPMMSHAGAESGRLVDHIWDDKKLYCTSWKAWTMSARIENTCAAHHGILNMARTWK